MTHAVETTGRDNELARERDTLQVIMESTNACIAYLDRDFNFIMVNSTYARGSGHAKEELIGRNHFDLFSNTENEEIFRRARDNGEAIEYRARPFEFADQPERGITYWDWTLTPVKDLSGRVHSLVLSLVDITESISLAMQNARLLAELQDELAGRMAVEEALEMARNTAEYQLRLLQRALLPADPAAIEGYELAHAYRAAYEGQEIGGDFYDVFLTEDNQVGLFIGDVSGKGIQAASLAAAARSTIRAFTYDMSAPSSALEHANSVLIRQQVESGQFLTVFLATLHPETGLLRYSSAGHPPPMIRRFDGSMEALSFGDPPIGLVDGYRFQEASAYLHPGDMLIAYTDGITEARYSRELFGYEGVRELLRITRDFAARETVGALLKATIDWSHGQSRDDTAILAIERKIQEQFRLFRGTR